MIASGGVKSGSYTSFLEIELGVPSDREGRGKRETGDFSNVVIVPEGEADDCSVTGGSLLDGGMEGHTEVVGLGDVG